MENKQVTVSDIKNLFNLSVVCGNKASFMRPILVPDLNRPGLELTGYYKHTDLKRIVVLGDKEMSYIKTLDKESLEIRFDFLTNELTPVIIVTKNHQIPKLLKDIAKSKNFPILKTDLSTTRLMVELITFLDAHFALSSSLHGTLLNVYGRGVLIIGESGMGKSELALELIKKGHLLIADDRVTTIKVHNQIIGRAPEILEGVLEIRGIGIINVIQMFGASSILEETDIDLVIDLQHFNSNHEYDRLGRDHYEYMDILGIDIPKLVLPMRAGRNMAVLVESAVTNHNLKLRGINSARDFDKKVIKFLKKKSKEERK